MNLLRRLIILVLLFNIVTPNVHAFEADPTPSPTDTDDEPEDYRATSLKMSGGGAGPVGGNSVSIFFWFCRIFVVVPLKTTVNVPAGGSTSHCLQVMGFPGQCPWPYFNRVRVTIIKKPKFGSIVTSSVTGFTAADLNICFNINMNTSSTNSDSFIYRLEYPRSIWGAWIWWWPKMYSRLGQVVITKAS